MGAELRAGVLDQPRAYGRRSRGPASLPGQVTPAIAGATVKALGTFCSVLVTRPAALAEAREILAGQLAAIDLACSRFRRDSELTALNTAGGAIVPVSSLFARALDVALRAAVITGGDVDPTCGRSLAELGYDRDYSELAARAAVPAGPPVAAAGWRCVELDCGALTARIPPGVQLDLGATAKALAADLAAQAIWERLGCGVLVNLGGDLAAAGQAPAGGWSVAVDDGLSADRRRMPNVAIEGGGLATSCPSVRTWRRGDQVRHHIVVPRTGLPAESCWAAVTVAAGNCVDANTASTASVIAGQRALAWLAELGLPARLVRADGSVVTIGGWPE